MWYHCKWITTPLLKCFYCSFYCFFLSHSLRSFDLFLCTVFLLAIQLPFVNKLELRWVELRCYFWRVYCEVHCAVQVADITFNFWNRLSELLYEDKRSDCLTTTFKPYIARLIIALCRLCQYDPHMVRWSAHSSTIQMWYYDPQFHTR